MNNPEYILVEEFGLVVTAVKQALNLPELNYQYGYVTELNNTLDEWSRVENFANKKYPLVYLAQPFTINRGTQGYFGEVKDLRVFILNESTVNAKAGDRMDSNFKPVLYPIYRELMTQLNNCRAFAYDVYRKHQLIDRYYWGQEQQQVLNDIVDCLIIQNLNLLINDNPNCITNFKSF